MKILVLSDTHGYLKNAQNVLKKLGDRMQMVIHLGDLVSDAQRLQEEFPTLPFHVVLGNNDYTENAPASKIVKVSGCKLLLTHGHRQHVHWNYDTISYWAEENEVDAVLFGHTHSTVNDANGRILLFNPGSISLPRDGNVPTFGVLDVENGVCVNASVMEFHGKDDFRIRSTAKSTLNKD